MRAVITALKSALSRSAPRPRSPSKGEGRRATPRPTRSSSSPAGRWRARSATIVEANGLDHIELTCLPAIWHNRPEKIAPRRAEADPRKPRRATRKIAVAYAECGTQGALDKVCEEEGVERIAGPHCYSFYWGNDAFAQRDDDDIDAFFLTDFLARQFESFVIEPLGLDRHPELRDMYFGNYRRLIFLAQTEDAELEAKAREAAEAAGAGLREARDRDGRPDRLPDRASDAGVAIRSPACRGGATAAAPASLDKQLKRRVPWRSGSSSTGATFRPR